MRRQLLQPAPGGLECRRCTPPGDRIGQKTELLDENLHPLETWTYTDVTTECLTSRLKSVCTRDCWLIAKRVLNRCHILKQEPCRTHTQLVDNHESQPRPNHEMSCIRRPVIEKANPVWLALFRRRRDLHDLIRSVACIINVDSNGTVCLPSTVE